MMETGVRSAICADGYSVVRRRKNRDASGAATARISTDQAAASTRERILDVALDLFTDQGFDGTSMREIAERLGISKPAIYYHFTSKEEILTALHMRLHEFGKAALTRLAGQTVTLQL
jgi:AcrR family transcriptional regulator